MKWLDEEPPPPAYTPPPLFEGAGDLGEIPALGPEIRGLECATIGTKVEGRWGPIVKTKDMGLAWYSPPSEEYMSSGYAALQGYSVS